MNNDFNVRVTPSGYLGWTISFFKEDIWEIIFGIFLILMFGVFLVCWALVSLIGWLWKSTLGKIVLFAVLIALIIFCTVQYVEYQHELDRIIQENEAKRHREAYNLLDDGTYEVSGNGIYLGETEIIISSEYDGKPVTRIGDGAFKERNITSITSPDSVTSIGKGAFEECEYLTSVSMPNSLTSIGESAFSGCSSLERIVLPNGVVEIGKRAFQNCVSLKSITLPGGITKINSHSFFSCDSLESLVIPEGVTSIDYHAFSFCKSLASVTIPQSLNNIGDNAFSVCKNLSAINYKGTIDEWNAITKVEDCWSSIDGILDWDSLSDDIVIYCANGVVSNE